MPKFAGYPQDTFKFLASLEKNNKREWFENNKDKYEALVREPSLDFIATMAPKLARISEHFLAQPLKTGGSLMRVYRDTRFSKDKAPYKTNIGIQFRHERGKNVHAPAYYLHLANDGCFIGAGMWQPESKALAGIRKRIATRPKDWQKVLNNRGFRDIFTLTGAKLVRPPKGYTADSPHVEDLKRKDFIATTPIDASQIHAPQFVDQVAAIFRKANPFMAFLCASVQVDF